jgi:TonB-linked SusC/RagA family outer membrane protein
MEKIDRPHFPAGRWEKPLFLMRTIILALACSVGVMVASPTYSQQAKIDVAYVGEPLSSVLNDLRSRTDRHLVYSPDLVAGKTPVTLRQNNASVEEILDRILPQNGLTYTVENNVISIIRARGAVGQQPAQERAVVGRVTDGHEPLGGVSVQVVGTATGTTTDVEGNYILRMAGARTGARLRFTMVGMAPFETEWNGRERINVIMTESREQIDEVVVTGVLNINRPDMVGSYNQMRMDSIYMPAYNSITDMLQGVVPGMMVTMPSVRAGASANIVIRGRTTLIGSTDPLWVVDGIEQTDVQPTSGDWDGSNNSMNELIGDAISWLNPQDVETITVLKDASATAIYGSRASNGVIVITTKKGTADRQRISFNYNVSVGERYNYGLYNLMNSQERINFAKEAYEAGVFYQHDPLTQRYTYEGLYHMFLDGDMSEQEFLERYKYLETVNTDWFDLVTRPSLNQNFNLSTSGGSQKATYSISASYAKNNALEKGNGSERFTGRMNVNMRFSDKVNVTANLVAGLTRTDGFAGGVNPLDYATRTSRAVPAYNEDGTPAFYQRREDYRYIDETKADGLPYNILDDMANTSTRIENPTMQASVDLKWTLLPELVFQLSGGMNLNSRLSESWMGENSFEVIRRYRGYRIGSPEAARSDYRAAAVLKNGGVMIHDQTYVNTYTMRAQLNYLKQFNDSRLTASVMWDIDSSYRNSKYNTVYGYDKFRGERVSVPTVPIDLNPTGNITAPSDYLDTYMKLAPGAWRSTNFTSNSAALAMIVAYSLKEKYVLNANFRNDWSNAFGVDAKKRFNPAWSLGLAWKLGQEEFLLGSRVISSADLRVTYGIQGNSASIATPEMVLEYKPTHPIFGESTSIITRIANPFKAWERTTSWNAGLDLGLFDNRIALTVEGYTRMSDAGRTFNEIPEMGGFSSTLPGTIIRNSGVEGSVSFTPINSRNWRVSLTANTSKNWNKIVKEAEREATSPNLQSFINGTSGSFVLDGYPLGAFWAYPYAGPDPDYGIPTFHYFPNDGTIGQAANMSPTEYMVYMGSKFSDITSGLSLRVSYKRLSINTAMTLIVGGKGYVYNPYGPFTGGRMPDPTMNLDRELLGRWTKDNPDSNFPGLYIVPSETEYPFQLSDPSIIGGGRTMSRYEMWAQSDARVASLTALRCRSINATWNINTANAKGQAAAMMRQAGLGNVQITAAVNNVFLIADKKWGGMDPDMGGNKKAPRSFTLGVNLGF